MLYPVSMNFINLPRQKIYLLDIYLGCFCHSFKYFKTFFVRMLSAALPHISWANYCNKNRWIESRTNNHDFTVIFSILKAFEFHRKNIANSIHYLMDQRWYQMIIDLIAKYQILMWRVDNLWLGISITNEVTFSLSHLHIHLVRHNGFGA